MSHGFGKGRKLADWGADEEDASDGELAIVDADEDAQLQAAITASLAEVTDTTPPTQAVGLAHAVGANEEGLADSGHQAARQDADEDADDDDMEWEDALGGGSPEHAAADGLPIADDSCVDGVELATQVDEPAAPLQTAIVQTATVQRGNVETTASAPKQVVNHKYENITVGNEIDQDVLAQPSAAVQGTCHALRGEIGSKPPALVADALLAPDNERDAPIVLSIPVQSTPVKPATVGPPQDPQSAVAVRDFSTHDDHKQTGNTAANNAVIEQQAPVVNDAAALHSGYTAVQEPKAHASEAQKPSFDYGAAMEALDTEQQRLKQEYQRQVCVLWGVDHTHHA